MPDPVDFLQGIFRQYGFVGGLSIILGAVMGGALVFHLLFGRGKKRGP